MFDEWNKYEWELSSGSKVAGMEGEENSNNEDIQDAIQESSQDLNSLEGREEIEDEVQIIDVVYDLNGQRNDGARSYGSQLGTNIFCSFHC